MAKIYEGNITRCCGCNSYIEYSDSDISTEEKGYGVGTYAGETYLAKTITCPKCGKKIEIDQDMVTEDYCSKEIYRLLIEKGFDGEIHTTFDKEGCTQPAITHQMAMDWLREEYKIAIDIRITCEKTISYAFDIWDFEIIHPNKFVGGTIDLREQQFGFKSYEDAVEAALKYCLEHLI